LDTPSCVHKSMSVQSVYCRHNVVMNYFLKEKFVVLYISWENVGDWTFKYNPLVWCCNHVDFLIGEVSPVLAQWPLSEIPMLRSGSYCWIQHATVHTTWIQSDRCTWWQLTHCSPVSVHWLARARCAQIWWWIYRFHWTSSQDKGAVWSRWPHYCPLQVCICISQ